MLTPEESIRIQNAIGADIIMQLDDVVESTLNGPRVEESTYRLFYVSLFYLLFNVQFLQILFISERVDGLIDVSLHTKDPTTRCYFLLSRVHAILIYD